MDKKKEERALGGEKSPTGSTLSASEQKIVEVLYRLQRLGFVPRKPHTMHDPGRVVHREPISEPDGDRNRIKFIRERRVRIEWGGVGITHVLELTLQNVRYHHVAKNDDVLAASKQVLSAHEEWMQQGEPRAEYEWDVIQLLIQEKYASGGMLEPRFVLGDPESIKFLLARGREKECGCGYF